ncbi:hypothetical protein G7Y89_g7123 [Cudoniella acicularis]|uniref:Uncharacterized protein n=1 Tax=Cudoniella acicularis TaxID=354080 RepID=A0A8H4W2D8_9HELO|nr:hypothetical protein G7Y89_g7123 [Cudoniella acicularis]
MSNPFPEIDWNLPPVPANFVLDPINKPCVDGDGSCGFTKTLIKYHHGQNSFVGEPINICPTPANSPQLSGADLFKNLRHSLTTPRDYQEVPIEPDAAVKAEVLRWVTEFEAMSTGNASGSRATTLRRPWDVHFSDREIEEDDYAFKIAKNMMTVYVRGEFEHSARLRQIVANSGQDWLNQRCAKMIAYNIWFDQEQPLYIGWSREECDARAAYLHERELATGNSSGNAASDSSASSTDSMSTTESSPDAPFGSDSHSAAPASVASSSESSDSKASSEEIVNFRPTNQKPTFRFEPSSIASRLPDFLAAMKASNEELASGSANKKIELSDNESNDGEHIEMNLGLGVLEEVKRESSPALSSPVTLKRNADVIDEPTTPPQKKLKLRIVNKDGKAETFSATPPPNDLSPSSTPKITLRLVHHLNMDDLMRSLRARSSKKSKPTKKGKNSKNSKRSKNSKKPKASDSSTQSGNDTSANTRVNFFIEREEENLINIPMLTEFETDEDGEQVDKWLEAIDKIDWLAGIPNFPKYVDPTEEELKAFANGILDTAEADQLEGYRVLHYYKDSA